LENSPAPALIKEKLDVQLPIWELIP